MEDMSKPDTPESCWLIVQLGNCELRRHPMDSDAISIGRSEDNDLVLEHLLVPLHAARLQVDEQNLRIKSLNRDQRVRLNGIPVLSSRVFHGDVLSVSRYQIIVHAPRQETDAADDPHPHPAYLIFNQTGDRKEIFPLAKKRVVVGRAADADCRLADWFCDERQVVIQHSGDNYQFKTVAEKAAVLLNGSPFSQGVLKEGDVLTIGTTPILFSHSCPSNSRAGRFRAPVEVAGEVEEAEEFDLEDIPEDSDPESDDVLDIDALEPDEEDESPLEQSAQPTEEEMENAPLDNQIRFWEKALSNKSSAVRKQAAIRLRELTGLDHES